MNGPDLSAEARRAKSDRAVHPCFCYPNTDQRSFVFAAVSLLFVVLFLCGDGTIDPAASSA